MPDWLDPKAPTLPCFLKAAGYRAAKFGKWHLSVAFPAHAEPPHRADARPQSVIVTSDGEIDDECSLVRFLLYANEWDIDGIITSSSQYGVDPTVVSPGAIWGHAERDIDRGPVMSAAPDRVWHGGR